MSTLNSKRRHVTIKEYLSSDYKDSVRCATTENGALSSAFDKDAVIDGVTLAIDDRILIKDQTDGAENGIYVVQKNGNPLRASDFNTSQNVHSGAYVHVETGNAAPGGNANQNYVLTTDTSPIVIDGTALVFNNVSSTDLNALTTETSIAQTDFVAMVDTNDSGASGKITFSNLEDTIFSNINSASSDLTMAAGGALTIAADAVTYAKMQNLGTGNRLLGSASSGLIGEVQVATAMIADDAVEYAKMQNISTGDRVLGKLSSGGVIGELTLAQVCFLKGTKITLPGYSQKNIEDLTLADDVLTYNIEGISNIKDKNVLKNVQLDSMNGRFSTSGIRNIWINPTDSYLFINDKLKVTKNHIVHFKRDNQYYFRFAEHLTIGDELMNDKEVYESVESIEEIHEKTNVYNFELDKDNTYFAENYLVHHYCELCSGYSNII